MTLEVYTMGAFRTCILYGVPTVVTQGASIRKQNAGTARFVFSVEASTSQQLGLREQRKHDGTDRSPHGPHGGATRARVCTTRPIHSTAAHTNATITAGVGSALGIPEATSANAGCMRA